MRLAKIGVCAVVALGVTAPAGWAFDSAPHADITRDALSAEGFGNTPVEIAQVDNWFIDLYENASKLPHSGHAGWGVTLLGGALFDREHWPERVVAAADRSHFDSTGGGFASAAALDAEWERLRRTTRSLLVSARTRNDSLAALTVLGITLHQVQDFYAHTNWVEPKGRAGFDGPGWSARGWGSYPTWFDIPAADRARERIYAGGSKDGAAKTRDHGTWRSDGNRDLRTEMNKDWSARPLYVEAYASAYFASRQWVQAARAWVADDAFWQRVRAYANRGGGDLDHDLRGSFTMSVYAGHWQGQGQPCDPGFSLDVCGKLSGPGGSLLDLRQATNAYFEDRAKTLFRRVWESYVVRVAAPAPVGRTEPVPPSRKLQEQTQLLRLQVNEMHAIQKPDSTALNPLNEADFYVRAGIAGQEFRSATIFGEDSFTFPGPNHGFTFLKAVPRGATFPEPLTSLLVEIETSGSRLAGTDDDVFLRIDGTHRFQLDKRLYDDFERGDRDTYSVPIDSVVESGISVGDIRFLQLEKSRDGAAGGWKLGAIKVVANDRVIYRNDRVERWLENDRRTWRAPGFRPARPVAPAVPVWLALWDEDGFLVNTPGGSFTIGSADDHIDLNDLAGRKDVAFAYRPGPAAGAYPTGHARYGGRLGDGDTAKLRYRIETILPRPPTGRAAAR